MELRMSRAGYWAGWVLTVLLAALFVFSATGKFVGGEDLDKELARIEIGQHMLIPLGVLEIACAALYLFPPTSVLGAILLTGYLGGAILTHWRVGDSVVLHIVLGVLVWLALGLREPRLWSLIPWRNPTPPPKSTRPPQQPRSVSAAPKPEASAREREV